MPAVSDSSSAAGPASHAVGQSDNSENGKKNPVVRYRSYKGEEDLPYMQKLIQNDLSEPYSIFTYRYFLNKWPELCFVAVTVTGEGESESETKETIHACIISKNEDHQSNFFPAKRGYIGMLAVDNHLRGFGVARILVQLTMRKMRETGARECILETEITNKGAMGLYENLGFIRHKRLPRYYLNGVDAFRYKYTFPDPLYIEDLRTSEELSNLEKKQIFRQQAQSQSETPSLTQRVS